MFNATFLLKVIDSSKTTKYISKLLFLSLLIVADFFTLFIWANNIGIFLYLAILATLIFTGTLLTIRYIKKQIKLLELNSSKGIYPKLNFFAITGLFIGGILIILPGLITTLLGLIIITPKLRISVGRNITKSLNLDWNAVYEYKEIYSS